MGTVLQHTLVYCSEKGMRKAVCIAIQTGCAGRGAGRRRRRWARRAHKALGACERWALAHGTGRQAKRARRGRGACGAA